ncbi:MAG TPA: nucleotidyltransferase domain-containing protein [Candidatus Brocadiia bacterium]|nr:nucleotidyltransferase family protein [Candidatus Brocadiales bacterium]
MDKKNIDELLLYCLSKETDKAMAERLAQLSPSDWECLIQQSVRHWVAPLLYQRLNALDTATTIPADIAQRLREIYLQCALKNSLLYRELAKVLGTLHDNNIPVIALKGIHLAEVVYGNIALRPMSDVDILVKKSDLTRVEEKLRGAGYALMTYRKYNKAWLEKYNCHFIFTPLIKSGANGGRLYLEVHWHVQRPDSPFKLDVDYFFERAQPVTIAGIAVLALSPEDLLLHLCINSVKDRFSLGLRAFCDISETIWHYQGRIDWEQLQKRVSQWGARKPVYLIFCLARKLLGAGVPDDVLDALKPDGFDPRVETWAREHIFDKHESPPITTSNLSLWRLKRFRDKVRFFITRVFPHPKNMEILYSVPANSRRIYLYYPAHLKILLRNHGKSAWRLLRRDKKAMAKARRVNNLADWMESS